jgi:hypothetical protein
MTQAWRTGRSVYGRHLLRRDSDHGRRGMNTQETPLSLDADPGSSGD